MKLSKTEASLSAAALKAGMTEKTARKWRQGGPSPNERQTPRTYRTRAEKESEPAARRRFLDQAIASYDEVLKADAAHQRARAGRAEATAAR